MGHYVALMPLTFGDQQFVGGDVLPEGAVDPERAGDAIYAGTIVYVPHAGEQYSGPLPSEHHHFSSEMNAVVESAIAAAKASFDPVEEAPKAKATKKAAAKKVAPESEEDQ